MNVSDEFYNTSNPDRFTNPFADLTIYNLLSSVIFAINLILGLPINIYVLWLIFKGKGNGAVSEFFSLNLTFCEIIFCFCGLFFVLSYTFPKFLVTTVFLCGIPICGRPFCLCLICVERYVAVVHPVTFLKYRPLRYRLACSAVVWMIILGFCVLIMLVYHPKNLYTFFCIVLTLYSLLFSVILFCCLAVVRALKHPGPGQKGKERDEANQVKRKAATVILIITVTAVIQFTPVLIVALIYCVLAQFYFDVTWTIVCSISLFVGYVHTFLYIHRTGCFSSS